MADRKDVLDFDDEDPTSEELQSQVQKAQDELSELKRRSEQIERDKLRLEELSRRQDELEHGKAEMLDKFTRSMVVIQRETQDAEKRLDQLNEIHESFTSHLRTLEAINPKAWVGLDLSKELSKAQSSVDDARGDFNRAQPKLGSDAPDEVRPAAIEGAEYEEYYASDKGFFYWLKSGFAFTLPIQIIGWLVLLLWVWSTTVK
jgi:DNA repair exonuclease SbcCD ATPase subunit